MFKSARLIIISVEKKKAVSGTLFQIQMLLMPNFTKYWSTDAYSS